MQFTHNSQLEDVIKSIRYWQDRIRDGIQFDKNHSNRDSTTFEKHQSDYSGMMNIESFLNLIINNMVNDASKIQHGKKLTTENINQTKQNLTGSDHIIDLDMIYSFFKIIHEKMNSEEKNQGIFYRKIDQTSGEYQKPTITVSDIHGSSTTLLFLLKIMHDLEKEEIRKPDRLMFNLIITGDVLDRGRRSINDLLVILFFYLVFPKDVIYVRGNHEDVYVNKRYGAEWVEVFDYKREALDLLEKIYNKLPVLVIVYNKQFYFHGGIHPESIIDYIKNGKQPKRRDIKNVTWLDVHLDEKVHYNKRGITDERGNPAIDNNLLDFFKIQDALDKNYTYMVVNHGHEFTEKGVKTDIFDGSDGKKIAFNLVASSIERGGKRLAGIYINCGIQIVNLTYGWSNPHYGWSNPHYGWSYQNKCFGFNMQVHDIKVDYIPKEEIESNRFYFAWNKIVASNSKHSEMYDNSALMTTTNNYGFDANLV